MSEVSLYVGGRGPHDIPKDVEGEERPDTRLRTFFPRKKNSRQGTLTRGPARKRTQSEQWSNLLATHRMHHAHHGRNEFRFVNHVLIQGYLAHTKTPAPLGPL